MVPLSYHMNMIASWMWHPRREDGVFMLIIDSFLDKSTRAEVLGTKGFFPELRGNETNISSIINSYHARDAEYYSPFYFWQGWWESEADTIKKVVIRKIWEHNLPCPIGEILGFEYWTRSYKTGQYHGVHVDNDTFLYADCQISNGPLIGSVYYGEDNKDGGFLEIHKPILVDGLVSVLEKGVIETFLSGESEIERVAYKGNRLIIDDFGHRMHSTTPFPSGCRQALVVSVWRKDNPPVSFTKGGFRCETNTVNTVPARWGLGSTTEIKLCVETPYGDEWCTLHIVRDGSAFLSMGTDIKLVIDDYAFDGSIFTAVFDVDTPMSVKIEIFLNIDFVTETINGYIKIDEYLRLTVNEGSMK